MPQRAASSIHLDDVGAPIQLLLFVFEKIGAGERIAIGLDIAPPAGDRRGAPAELPARMLGAQTPTFQTHRQGGRIGARVEPAARDRVLAPFDADAVMRR
jgi:hypothetical protein